MININ